MVKYSDFVSLNLRNFLICKPEVGADDPAGNIGSVRGDAAAGVQYMGADAGLVALLSQP